MKNSKRLVILVSIAALSASISFADTKLCAKQKVKPKKGLIDVASALSLVTDANCPKGSKEIKGALNDGSHIYGSGSDGARVISANATLEVGSHQYTTFTVSPGVTLTVPSGTVIRTTGAFTNNGTINVSTFAAGGTGLAASDTLLMRGTKPASAGIAPIGSGFGTFGSNSAIVASPFASAGASIGLTLLPGPLGGGGGAPGDGIPGGFGGQGGAGGGTLVLISKTSISNAGTIDASGGSADYGGGGGGGGILVFAARTSFTSTGPIRVNGGSGGLPTAKSGSGGGGGGGNVSVVSPQIADNSTIAFAGGAGVQVSAAGTVTDTLRSSGGAGGASFGAGGQGGGVLVNGTASASFAGNAGVVNFVAVKPEGLF